MTGVLLFVAWLVTLALAFSFGAFAGSEHEKRRVQPVVDALTAYFATKTALRAAQEADAKAAQAVIVPHDFGARAH